MKFLTIFASGCSVGAAAHSIGSAGYQPGMIAQLTLLFVAVIVACVAAFVFLLRREA